MQRVRFIVVIFRFCEIIKNVCIVVAMCDLVDDVKTIFHLL